jgi:hypothetical protein
MKAVLLLIATSLLLPVRPAAGQGGTGLEPAATLARSTRADSTRVNRGARAAQAAFERVRFHHLPWTDGSGSGGVCDERIGRFCIWSGPDDEDWEPPLEPPPVRAGRDTLLAVLARAAAAAPGDTWVAGQRVRYLVEAGRAADAVRAARGCQAARWWCLALDGYALHFAGDIPAAERAFSAALEDMPPAERREWDSYNPLLVDGDARDLRRMSPSQRASTERTLWWLADPFWMDPGNNRRTEHYSRLVADRFQDRARTTEGLFWADDLREILVRWGQPSGWERIRPRFGQQAPAGVITHYAPSFEFMPTLAMVRAPFAIKASDWKPDARGAHSSYAPPRVRHFANLPFQVAVFPRGANAEVVAAFAMKTDSLPVDPTLDAGVVLMRAPDAPALARIERVRGARGVLRLNAPADSTVLSLEARESTTQRAARARFALDLRRPLSNGVGISDVLLLEGSEQRPGSLDEAAPLARGSTRFRPGDRLALYWEVYGLGSSSDSVTFSLALARRSPGAVQRAVESIGLSRAVTPVRMRWEEEVAPGGVLGRSLAIALPGVPPGAYVLEVGVKTRAGATATSFREITVER